MAKKKWAKRTLKLKKNHGWTCRDGYSVFVADRGAVRFDIPRGWVIEPGEKGSIKIMDREPPDDDCTLEMTIFYLNDQIDWSGLPLARMVDELTREDDEGVLERERVVEERSENGTHLAYRRSRFLDRNQNREAYSYILIARRWNIQPLITFAYWVDDAPRVEPAWKEVLRSLVLGDYVEDPTQRLTDV